MPKLTPYILAVTLLSLTTLTSCRKVYDFIRDHPDGHDTLCRVTKISFGPYDPSAPLPGPMQVGITYNRKGDPVDMLVLNPWVPYTTIEQHFRYDRFNRLTDYIENYRGGEIGPSSPPIRGAAVGWHKYAYPHTDIITDTPIYYSGYPINGSAPVATPGQLIYLYKFNAAGKMIAMAQTVNLPHQPPPIFTPIAYDAHGNKDLSMYTNIVYDSAVCVYRTNKVWQLVYGDYSRNNPVLVSPFPFQIPTPTNQFGLPTQLPYLSNGPVLLFGVGASTYLGDSYTIEYACSAPKGPIDY